MKVSQLAREKLTMQAKLWIISQLPQWKAMETIRGWIYRTPHIIYENKGIKRLFLKATGLTEDEFFERKTN